MNQESNQRSDNQGGGKRRGGGQRRGGGGGSGGGGRGKKPISNRNNSSRENPVDYGPAPADQPMIMSGILDIPGKADGRIRQFDGIIKISPNDPVLPQKFIDEYELRPGLLIEVRLSRPSNKPVKYQAPRKVRANTIAPDARTAKALLKVEDLEPEEFLETVDGRRFEDLTSIDPEPIMTLEYKGCSDSARLIDMFCPIGYGQRGMIVSPPKAGKTTLLKNIANSIQNNHPECEVTALLIDERPEEVTDFRRSVPCTVLASSNDNRPEQHCLLAMMAIERAKRQVEQGKHIVILMDSLTRLGRAFNTAPGVAVSGRTLSGGVDASALAIPKQLFGAARNTEEGGSLTIIATALVDTGSRGDQLIFEEFKGTGNMELILDRKVAEKRLFPAINLAASGTRKEDKLIDETSLATINALRRRLLNMPPPQQIEQLLKAVNRFETNADLLGNPQSPASQQQGKLQTA